MKKLFAISLASALSLTLLAGCGGGNEPGGHENNADPTISGVQTSATVLAGEEFDALAGVTAFDKEDGDITSKITVSAVGLTFTDGKTTPTEPSEFIGYEIIYTVKDSDGATATEYCTLYVKQAAAELENVFTADFSDITPAEADKHWWDFVNDGAEAAATLKQGAYVVDVTDLKGVGDDNLMLTRSFADLGAGDYEFVVWASSSVATKINMNALLDGEDNWDLKNLGGGKYNEEVGTSVKAISHKFTLNKDNASILFRICLGGGDRPGAFSFAVEKIAIYKTTGVETKTSLQSYTFADSTEGLYGTDEARVSQGNGGAALAITYGENADWAVKATVGLAGMSLDKGKTYYYSFKLKAENALTVNVCVEQNEVNDAYKNRASFHGFSLNAGEEKVITATFEAGKDQSMNDVLEDAVCRLYLGLHDAAVTTNNVTISNFDFGKVEGNLKTDRVAQDKFILFGKGSSNETNVNYPYDLFNGSDDGVSESGVGTAYIENGKLVYKIHEGSTSGWQNKLVIGYWDNPINLPADAYYVVTLKIKASAAIGFDLCLHDMDCGDNWDSGLLYRRAHWQNDAIQIGTTEQTVEFTTDIVYKESKCELILEFGSSELSALAGGVTIEISELSIGVRKVAD